MRVAHVITRMIVGGAQENTLYNCLDLRQQYDDRVLLVTGPALGPEGDLLQRGRAGDLRVEVISSLRRNIHPRDALAYRDIRKALAEFEPDVVHTHSAKGGWLGRRAAAALDVPAIIHSVHGAPFHDYQSALARRFFISCERYAARFCHRFICVADAMTNLMVEAGVAPVEKFKTIYSGMETGPFLEAKSHRKRVRSKLGIAPEEVVFAKVARFFHLKGHDDLIEAASKVIAQSDSPIKFLLLGDGILRPEMESRMSDLGIRDHFIMPGLVPPAQIPEMLGACDAVVHTSYREGLARALVQGLLTGLPVISYDIDGAREVVLPGQTGFLVAAGDQNRLVTSMSELASDQSLRERLGKEGQKRFAPIFDHREMTQQIRELYLEVLSEGAEQRTA
ncbi:MAG: glycosyltransferase family 4 protein [Planctomycetota bacterium]